MKRILGLIVLFFCFYGISAQESQIQTDMEFFSQKLNIEASQRASLSKIIIRKHQDLEAIIALRSTDENLFRQKRRSIVSGAEGSIKMMLSEDQMKLWYTYKADMRKANAERTATLKANNADKQDLLDAQYGIKN